MSFPAAVLVGCVVVHIAISPVLIFGFGPLPALGPAGAGWGLVIPFAGGSILMIWYLRSRAIVRLNFRGVTPRWELFADILRVGVPGLINIAHHQSLGRAADANCRTVGARHRPRLRDGRAPEVSRGRIRSCRRQG
jgi:Na+-driven multidrug efflux pump